MMANTQCDLLLIDKDALEKIFAADPLSARRVCVSVLKDFEKRDLQVSTQSLQPPP